MIKKEEVKNILITRTDRLGDVILTLPLVDAVRSVFGSSKIFFLSKEYVSGIVKNYPGVDEQVNIESIPGFSDKCKFVKEKEIDLVINVKPEFDLALCFFLSGIKYRIGTGYRWYSFLYNQKVHEHRKTSDKHESEYNLNLIRKFFPEAKAGETTLQYDISDKEDLDKKLSGYGLSLNDDYIIIHPGSGNSAKDLPASKFGEFIKKFVLTTKKHKIVLTGIGIEKKLVNEIIDLSKVDNRDRIVDLSGKLTLNELVILIDKCDVFISNSTGPIHIAGSLNKKIIGFYPNEKVMSDVRWGPLSKNVVIIKPGADDDMSNISADEILKATQKFI